MGDAPTAAELRAITEIRKTLFRAELQALLDKHRVSLEVVDRYDGAIIEATFHSRYATGGAFACLEEYACVRYGSELACSDECM